MFWDVIINLIAYLFLSFILGSFAYFFIYIIASLYNGEGANEIEKALENYNKFFIVVFSVVALIVLWTIASPFNPKVW